MGALSGLLRATATATTNPDPNTLTTTDPYPSTYVDRLTASSTWTTQATSNANAIVMRSQVSNAGRVPLTMGFEPTADGVSYTIKRWVYNIHGDVWMRPEVDANFNLQGYQIVTIDNPGWDPMFFEIDTISSGNMSIRYDNCAAELL